MDVLIYRGATDAADPSTVYRVRREDGDVKFRKGVPVPLDKLPDELVDELVDLKDHDFELADAEAPEPYAGYHGKTAEQIISDLRSAEPSAAARMAERILDSEEDRSTVIEAAEAITGAATDSEEDTDGEDAEGVTGDGE